MKKLYFIFLLVVVSLFLIFLYVLLAGLSASISISFLNKEYGVLNLVIMRAFAVIASVVAGFIVAFPMGYFTRKKSILYGFAMPLIGMITLFQPWKYDSLQLIIWAYLEWIALFLSCGFFWYLGQKIRNRKLKSTP
ncbi:MAG: hypothetical protein KJ887_00595 [Candidatus Omnitrophica bacterium]|nr:hypothetical protein [Candidatus Omnitrophota bacterium]MBU1047113.1 hypothetical protein [Candidatus Omnitrophota bacterium]MBU1631461.1 hypothetical protein [Candidatus Omnitrophota bacterium]MBU1767694.1 hypothetical protein [Candidatus Omnitrophota bacterium]MBU1889609.1 hypothetical protein [Candidatus Omnitrophota bacterium]